MQNINFQLFELIEATSSKNAKVELLRQMGDAEKKLIQLALSPDLTFKLQRIDYPPEHLTAFFEPTLDNFINLCTTLNARKALRDIDRYDVGSFICAVNERHGELAAKWVERVLLKDLRCGFDTSSANKAFPGLIETYACSLADTFDIEKDVARIKDSIVDAKLDGLRGLAKVENGNVVIRSRSGKILENFPNIAAELSKLPNGKYDGEIVIIDKNKNNFQLLMNYVKGSKVIPEELNYRFCIFDMVSDEPYEIRRRKIMENLCYTFTDSGTDGWIRNFGKRLAMTVALPVHTLDNLLNFLNMAEEAGLEGVMLKSKDTPYKAKRSKNILKLKKFYDMEATIVNFEEGTGRNEYRLGAIVCVDANGIVFKAGSGFTDEMREDFWFNSEKYLGRLVTIKYQEKSRDGVPRFPIFMRFRSDVEMGL